MGWPSTPEYNTSFYQMSRHAEIVITRDRDCFAFFPDMVAKDATQGMEIYRDDTKAVTQWTSAMPPTVAASERVLLWARASGTEMVSAFRWVPYITSSDVDSLDILPLREVYAPRVAYDRESNTLHLWFWTNVNWDYNSTDYDEAEIYQIGAKDYDQAIGTSTKECKKVLCYAVGHFEHMYVKGGFVGNFLGQPMTSTDEQYDLIPIFTRPKIITNYDPVDADKGPGLITDGWYPNADKYPFQLVRAASNTLGMRCGYRCRNGIFNSAKKGLDGVGGPSSDLNDLWTHTFTGATTNWLRLRFTATGSPLYNSPEVFMNTTLTITLESLSPDSWSADPFHRDLCVGKIVTDISGNITTMEQWWHGGNEDDTAVVPDTNSTAACDGYPAVDTPDPSPNPTRSTLQIYEPGGGSHRRELQLYDVNTVPLDTITFPYFESEAAPSASNQLKGLLKWAILDSQNTKGAADYKSLGLRADVLLPPSGKQVLEIFGFKGAYGHAAPYKKQTATPTEVEWRYPVKGNAATDASATPGSADTNCWDTVTASTTTPPGTTGGTPISPSGGYWYDCGDLTISWTADMGRVTANGDGTGNVYDPVSGSAGSTTFKLWLHDLPDHQHQHTTLAYNLLNGPDATKQANTDHDWRYWIQGDTYSGSCFGRSIGYGTVTHTPAANGLRIELNTCRLYYDNTNWTVDWKECELKGPAGAGEWDVLSGTTFRVLHNAAITYGNAATGALQVTGGTSIAGALQTTNATDITSGAASGAFYCMGGATITKKLQILDTTDASTYAGDSGALQVKGGMSVNAHIFCGGGIDFGFNFSGTSTNYWVEPAFRVNVDNQIQMNAGSSVTIEAATYMDLKFLGTQHFSVIATSGGGDTTVLKHEAGIGYLQGADWRAVCTNFYMNPGTAYYDNKPAVDNVQIRVQPSAGGAPINVWIRKGGITST